MILVRTLSLGQAKPMRRCSAQPAASEALVSDVDGSAGVPFPDPRAPAWEAAGITASNKQLARLTERLLNGPSNSEMSQTFGT